MSVGIDICIWVRSLKLLLRIHRPRLHTTGIGNACRSSACAHLFIMCTFIYHTLAGRHKFCVSVCLVSVCVRETELRQWFEFMHSNILLHKTYAPVRPQRNSLCQAHTVINNNRDVKFCSMTTQLGKKSPRSSTRKNQRCCRHYFFLPSS